MFTLDPAGLLFFVPRCDTPSTPPLKMTLRLRLDLPRLCSHTRGRLSPSYINFGMSRTLQTSFPGFSFPIAVGRKPQSSRSSKHNLLVADGPSFTEPSIAISAQLETATLKMSNALTSDRCQCRGSLHTVLFLYPSRFLSYTSSKIDPD